MILMSLVMYYVSFHFHFYCGLFLISIEISLYFSLIYTSLHLTRLTNDSILLFETFGDTEQTTLGLTKSIVGLTNIIVGYYKLSLIRLYLIHKFPIK